MYIPSTNTSVRIPRVTLQQTVRVRSIGPKKENSKNRNDKHAHALLPECSLDPTIKAFSSRSDFGSGTYILKYTFTYVFRWLLVDYLIVVRYEILFRKFNYHYHSVYRIIWSSSYVWRRSCSSDRFGVEAASCVQTKKKCLQKAPNIQRVS